MKPPDVGADSGTDASGEESGADQTNGPKEDWTVSFLKTKHV